MIPMQIMNLIAAAVGQKRIQAFLDADEMEPPAVKDEGAGAESTSMSAT